MTTLNQAALEKAQLARDETKAAHQGFTYGNRQVIRNLKLSPGSQEVWSISGDASQYQEHHMAMKKELTCISDRAFITTYLTELSKTHAIVPRKLDEDILEGMFARTEGFPMAEMDEIHAALIAEIDAREAGR